MADEAVAAETVVYENTDLSAKSEEELSSLIKGEAAQDKAAEPVAEKEPVVETPKVETPEPPKGPTVDELQAELDKYKKQVTDKEQFIQRQALEIGTLRKQQPQTPVLPENLNIVDHPVEAVQTIINQRDQALFVQRLENQSLVQQAVPDLANHMDTIVQLALADGYSERDIALFRQDPYLYSTPTVLIGYARRAAQLQEQAQLRTALAEKDKEIATLKTKPEELLKKVEKAAKETPGLTGKAGETATKHDISEKQLHMMSDAELDAFLKEQNNR